MSTQAQIDAAKRELARRELAVREKAAADPLAIHKGLLEGALNLASRVPAVIGGGLSGLASFGSSENKGKPFGEVFDRSVSVIRDISDKLVFEPRTEAGEKITGLIDKPFELFEKGINFVGEGTADITGSPAVGAVVKTVLGAAPLALGIKTGGPVGVQFRRGPQTRRQVLAQEANRNGYVVETKSAAEGLGGIAKVREEASFRNQKRSNELVREEFGLAEGTPLLPEEFALIRSEAAEAYNVLRDQGTINFRTSFRRDLSNAVKELKKVERELEGVTGSKDLFARVRELMKKDSIDADAAVSIIQITREKADRAFIAKKSKKGAAWKKVADALEGAFEAELNARGEFGLVRDFRDSRQTIAKAYTAENALVGENVSAPKLAASSKPLTGNLKIIADFGKNFRRVARVIEDPATAFSAAGFGFASLAAPGAFFGLAAGGPLGLLAGATPAILTALRPILRAQALSNRPGIAGIGAGGQRSAVIPPLQGQLPGLLGAAEIAEEGLLAP